MQALSQLSYGSYSQDTEFEGETVPNFAKMLPKNSNPSNKRSREDQELRHSSRQNIYPAILGITICYHALDSSERSAPNRRKQHPGAPCTPARPPGCFCLSTEPSETVPGPRRAALPASSPSKTMPARMHTRFGDDHSGKGVPDQNCRAILPCNHSLGRRNRFGQCRQGYVPT